MVVYVFGPASTYWTMKKQKFKQKVGTKALNIGVLLKCFFIYVYFLKLTAKGPESYGGWKMTCFFLGQKAYFQEHFAVSGRVFHSPKLDSRGG